MSTEVNATTLALEAAYSWVSAVCDWDECDTVERAVAYLTQERDSLGWREFEENCRYSLALSELGQTCDNVVINPEFLIEFFELTNDEQDLVIAWLDYHNCKNFCNDPTEILEKYHGTYSIAEYVQKYLEESGIEMPDCIHLDYNQSFEDLTRDYTCIDVGNGSYMIFDY